MIKKEIFRKEMVPLIEQLLEISKREKLPILLGVSLGDERDCQTIAVAHECLEMKEEGSHLRMVKTLMDVKNNDDLKECVVGILRGAGAVAVRMDLTGDDDKASLDKVKEILDAIKGAGDATRH